ncbi:hypothetical protein [Bifidobacterium ramosum]|uniref:Uncharacterized protein n=1 Tax=Bifidobacterium ramosum TaxID=1798158 RepID=A0A7K3T9W7_9BIFI|nr:hypothetical protein [Bifidobacterium ramosum]NEG70999.1 hypothetical protein [Bifidobacterium ramosum]
MSVVPWLPAITGIEKIGPAADEVTATLTDKGRAIHVAGKITPVAGQDRYCVLRCGLVSLPAGTYTLANSLPAPMPDQTYVQLSAPNEFPSGTADKLATNANPQFALKGGNYPLQIVIRTPTAFDVTIRPRLDRLA